MYQFNRFFLIFSLLFSYVVPFISIKTEASEPINNPQVIFEETTQQILVLPPKQEDFRLDESCLDHLRYHYTDLLIKTIISILKIKKLKGKRVNYLNNKLFLTEKNISPFSFWNTIYLGENYLINNEIDHRIFTHEKSHLKQKHSFDLLLVEALKIFTWFNPAIYFYKKAMITNHEFLADEAVFEK